MKQKAKDVREPNFISDALVSINGKNHSKITDEYGNFEFSIAKTEIKISQ